MLLAEYSLSKRTEVYGTVDFIRGTGAAKQTSRDATTRPALQSAFATYSDRRCPVAAGHDTSEPTARTQVRAVFLSYSDQQFD